MQEIQYITLLNAGNPVYYHSQNSLKFFQNLFMFFNTVHVLLENYHVLLENYRKQKITAWRSGRKYFL
jgi:hypothetical protein